MTVNFLIIPNDPIIDLIIHVCLELHFRQIVVILAFEFKKKGIIMMFLFFVLTPLVVTV